MSAERPDDAVDVEDARAYTGRGACYRQVLHFHFRLENVFDVDAYATEFDFGWGASHLLFARAYISDRVE